MTILLINKFEKLFSIYAPYAPVQPTMILPKEYTIINETRKSSLLDVIDPPSKKLRYESYPPLNPNSAKCPSALISSFRL